MTKVTTHPLITVIVATYNSEKHLNHCLKSIKNQDYPRKQIIVIDGKSQDNTVNIIQQYQDSIAYWCSEPDRGIAHAWNKGLAQAKGEWICFLGSDDFFLHHTVLTQLSFFFEKCHRKTRIIYSNIFLLSINLKVLKKIGEPWEIAKKKFLSGSMNIPHPGMLHHCSLFRDFGQFDETFKITLDYDFLLRELKKNDAFYTGSDLVAVGMIEGGISNKLKNRLKVLKEIQLALKKNNLPQFNITIIGLWIRAIILVFLEKAAGSKNTMALQKKYRLVKKYLSFKYI